MTNNRLEYDLMSDSRDAYNRGRADMAQESVGSLNKSLIIGGLATALLSGLAGFIPSEDNLSESNHISGAAIPTDYVDKDNDGRMDQLLNIEGNRYEIRTVDGEPQLSPYTIGSGSAIQ